MSWIIDALKEPFTKKGKKAETDEDKLKQIEELKLRLKEEEEKIKQKQDIKVIKVKEPEIPELPLPPKFEPKQEEQETSEEVTTDKRLEILEQNLNVVITDIHNRVTAIESYLFRTK